LRQLPLPPRLARMVVDAGDHGQATLAADVALLLTERGLGGNDIDLAHRLDAFRRDRSLRAGDARAMAKRWADIVDAQTQDTRRTPSPAYRAGAGMGPGALLALAYPDRVAKSRGAGGSFLLANGRGANLDQASPLSREPFLAVGEVAGTAAKGGIVLAAALTLAEIEALFADTIESRQEVTFDAASASLRGRRLRRLGALSFAEQTMKIEPTDETARMLAEGVARLGIGRLPWTKVLQQWRDRVQFLRRAQGAEWPDLSDAGLAALASDWLAHAFAGKTALSDLGAVDLTEAVHRLVPWPLRRRLEAEAPTHFTAPSGSVVPVDYENEEGPKLSIRVQELFGLDSHPSIAGGRVPLVVELLSPAHRPVQVTRDLPGFWRGSYAAVKADMKGRYPRHPWPDDPLAAPATRRAKPRGQ
jgi:ATP-dependent helicase HrpB